MFSTHENRSRRLALSNLEVHTPASVDFPRILFDMLQWEIPPQPSTRGFNVRGEGITMMSRRRFLWQVMPEGRGRVLPGGLGVHG